jgi:hypothetical protein
MDVADAINIMLYASPRSDGQPGCAVWDVYRAQDADTIRAFLKEKFGGKVFFTDPIHSQVFYLDSALRKELADEYGVVSFRVYQYPVSPFLDKQGPRWLMGRDKRCLYLLDVLIKSVIWRIVSRLLWILFLLVRFTTLVWTRTQEVKLTIR